MCGLGCASKETCSQHVFAKVAIRMSKTKWFGVHLYKMEHQTHECKTHFETNRLYLNYYQNQPKEYFNKIKIGKRRCS